MAAIVLENLTLGYDGAPAVVGASGAFAMGRSTAVVGPNGSGKSTLLKALAGRLKPLDGAVRLQGLTRRDIAYLPQEAGMDRDFPITLVDHVALGFEQRLGLFRGLGAAERARLSQALEWTGLKGLEQRPIRSLSGGQFQRALFARVVVQDAPVILLDEPFVGLDDEAAADLVQIIERWRAQRRTLVIVLHDLGLARALSDETLIMGRGPPAWGPTADVLTPDYSRPAQMRSRDLTGDAA